jgi:hypothetical protein
MLIVFLPAAVIVPVYWHFGYTGLVFTECVSFFFLYLFPFPLLLHQLTHSLPSPVTSPLLPLLRMRRLGYGIQYHSPTVPLPRRDKDSGRENRESVFVLDAFTVDAVFGVCGGLVVLEEEVC